ncbi:helix-turn-helix transcriptional regulator [Streptomyces sp. SM14]|uniref:helix-turn-helix domain-containing protein n=1 Tax=Streptomyces sp. SM14 TaxID=1736045 RepID=UPI00215641DF|nr:helix-turn-helix transcriptional regulator [Streptomyces sp. SM14]
MNPAQRFGQRVKRVRVGRKLTQKQLGKATGYSEAYVSKVEAGKLPVLPSEKFARGCDLVFGTYGLFVDMLEQMGKGDDHPSWFVPYVNFERRASMILDYSATSIMGMLQTERYAGAIFRAGYPHEANSVIKSKVDARVGRFEVMKREAPPTLWVVLHEGCLRTEVGGPSVMEGQLEHLLQAAESPHIDLQVVPFSAGASAAHILPFTLLTFESSPTVLYSDDPEGGRLYDRAASVAAALQNYDRLRAHAMAPDDSVALIQRLHKEYTHE